eukprot:scaffold5085_cov115-Cylindrotheca_fusiformis.AAC.3
MRVDHTGRCVKDSNKYLNPILAMTRDTKKTNSGGKKASSDSKKTSSDSKKTKKSKAADSDSKKGSKIWTKVVPPPSKHTVPASKKSAKKSKGSTKPDVKSKDKNKDKKSPTKNSTTSAAKDAKENPPASSKRISSSSDNTKKKEKEPKKRKIKIGHKTVEIEQPPKTLLLIWLLMASELALDLVTTGIAFVAFLAEPGDCCDKPINSGAGPLSVTVPFFFLVIAELIFLLRSILLTLWPKWMMNQAAEMDPEEQKKTCCSCKWTPKIMMWLVNYLTVINPFFGFGISWMLMYRSDKDEALVVMALEAVTIILHFVSVHLEKAATTWKLKLMHGFILVPWLATLGINVWYINKGGVCYDTVLETFWYKGCEICPNGVRAVNDTLCPTTTLVNGVNETTYETYGLLDLDSATYCDGEKDVCWFPY